ncbi:serine hydrolase, partial [Methylobacterium radiotolerans]|uniref:serine hydrolase n=1 Tax=Methylobacterium radiotolerans TaxID=31998 RepID=UPI003F67EC44
MRRSVLAALPQPAARGAGGGTGGWGAADLGAAPLVWSGNAAANLPLADLGGPAALTAWLRTTGDPVTRLDRTEPTLNTALPGDPRDTTTPDALRATLGWTLPGPLLSPASRARPEAWWACCAAPRQRRPEPAPRVAGGRAGTPRAPPAPPRPRAPPPPTPPPTPRAP